MAFRATDNTGRVVENLTPAALDELLLHAGLVTIENPDWGVGHHALAERQPDSSAWRIEITSPTGSLVSEAPGRSAAYDILRSWAAADGWWQEAFTWRPA